jgi:hypothetical protein
MGITTAASEAAPALLEQAEQHLRVLRSRAADLEPSAPDLVRERRYYAAASKAAEYASAIDELRAALGLETHASAAAADREERAQAARAAAEAAASAEAAAQAASVAAEQAARTKACDDMQLQIVDSRGQRVFLVEEIAYSDDGEVVVRQSVRLIAEDGLDVTGEVVATPEGEFRLDQPYPVLHPSGGTIWYGARLVAVETTATSDWLPHGAVVPPYRSEYQVAQDWADAEQARADNDLLAALADMPEPWLRARANLVEAFASDPSARFGGQNGRKFSVREKLRSDLDEYQAVQRAAAAEEAARLASSPFAALAALRRST